MTHSQKIDGLPPRRYWLCLIAAGLLLVAGYLGLLAASPAGQRAMVPLGGDFVNVWAGPRIAVQHLSDLFDAGRYSNALDTAFGKPIDPRNWSYPLFCLWFYTPFSWLPYSIALISWTVVGAACLYAAARPMLPRQSPWWAAVMLLSPFALINLFAGQNGFFTASLALVALAQLDRRPWLAGLCIGLLSMKPQLGLLWPVALLAMRAWRPFVAAAVTVLCLYGASLAWHGVASWQAYQQSTVPFQLALATDTEPLRIYHAMMVSLLPSLRILGVGLTAAWAMQLLVTTVVVIGTYLAFPRLRDPAARAVLIGSGTLLASPYAFNYDMGVLVAGGVALAMRQRAWQPWGAAMFLLPILASYGVMLHWPLAPFLLLGVFAAQVFCVRPLP